MAALPRPGVSVVQVFRSVSPTVITPTLVPCTVGVCKQIVDVMVSDGTGGMVLNSEAQVTLPGLFVAKAAAGDPPRYTGLDGLVLAISANGGPATEVAFSGNTLSNVTVVSQINKALLADGVTSIVAETVGDDSWELKTRALGEFQSLSFTDTTDTTVASTFALAIDKVYAGASNYTGYALPIRKGSFPDPRGNMEHLAIDSSTARAFVQTSPVTLVELSRTSTVLDWGGTSTPAVVTGDVDITAGALYGALGTLDGKTLTISVDGTSSALVLDGATNAASKAALLAAIEAEWDVTAEEVSTFLVLTSDSVGADASIVVTDAGAGSVLIGAGTFEDTGEDPVYTIDDGNGDNLTPLVMVNSASFTASPTVASVIGSVDVTGLTLPGDIANKTLTLSDGGLPQTFTFSSEATLTAVVDALEAFFGAAGGGGLLVQKDSNKYVKLSSLAKGREGVVKVVGGTAATVLGFTVGTTRGTAFKPLPGDELWVDGALYGTITRVSPGAEASLLRIDKFVPISTSVGGSWYIVANKLAGVQTASRPSADLVVDLNGGLLLKHEVIRDTTGSPVASKGGVFVDYEAVRKDVTALAEVPGLLRFQSTTEVDSQIAPISAKNPLALGSYFMLLNAPGIEVTALGVDEISADSPYGTVEAFTRAATLLEGYEVYAIAPLTHEPTVGQVFMTHATVMSEPDNKGERIVLFNPERPTHRVDTLVASGTGDSSGNTGLSFDTNATNLPALLLAASIDPTQTIAVDVGLYLNIRGGKYSVESVNGSVVTIRTTFSAGENDDAYYEETALNVSPLPNMLIDEIFSVKIRGTELVLVDGTPDKPAIADTLAAMASGYSNRRFWNIVPDKCAAVIDGLEQTIEGFYLCSAIAGMIGQNPPQQSFTNFPMTGFTQVIGSQDYFSNRQMDVIAGGGNYVVVQDNAGTPLLARMALTTDMTSVETRTDSITKVVDFTAKFLRRGLKNFIGRFNITQGFLDSIGHVTHGLLGFLVESGVLMGAHLDNIIQDETNPDTVLLDIQLDVPYPCNYLKLTLVI